MKHTALDTEARRRANAQDWLVSGGAMGDCIRSLDWSRTALGPVASWPQSLRTTVSLCLASNFPISIAWGPKHIQIYNDGYWPICGGKHPDSMGQDFTECWASAWPAIGEAFERALEGETSYLENQRMFLDRNGYLEETFFTFSFSPIRDETAGVGGVFHPVTETTEGMLAERRTRMLRDLNARCARAQNSDEVYTLAAETLKEFSLDLPFVLFYEIDAGSQTARLVASTGIEPGTPASATSIDLRAQAPLPAWPIAQVAHANAARQIDDLEGRLGAGRCGPYPEQPKSAWLLPIRLPGAESANGLVILGTSSRLPFNDSYRAALEFVASTLTAAVTRARAPERIDTKRALSAPATSAAAYVEETLRWLPQSPRRAVSPPPAGPTPSAATPGVSRASGSASSSRPRILWADDNADMRDYVSRLLSPHYEVTPVGDGASALATALQNPPDLVLSDAMLPGPDGFGLLRELRADARTRTVPIILLSARAGEEAAVEGFGAGADDYLAQPFSARELLARVRTHLELSRTRGDWAEQLERSNRELEAFSYSVSHDLRAPLRAIDGFSKALLVSHGDKLDDQAKSYLDRVRAATLRMSLLIDDLLSLSRISRGELRRQSIDITRLAQTAADELARQPDAHPVHFEVEAGLTTDGDSRLLAVALANLLGNAWKFTSKVPNARVTVGRVEGTSAVFFVRDNGAGFDMTYVENLFRPFHRLHTQADYKGRGIGLATVQRIVGRHGGRVWAEGTVGGGATFYFTLERARWSSNQSYSWKTTTTTS